jgi:uncharacterized membrane protein YqaE (UPF0057 family)
MKLKLPFLSLILLALLASCHISNDVTNGRLIQKRKYNDGFYFDFGKGIDGKCGNDESRKVASDEAIDESFEPTAAITNEPQPATEEIAIDVPVDMPVVEPMAILVEEPAEINPDSYRDGIAEPADITNHKRSSVSEKVGRFYKRNSVPAIVEAAKAQSSESVLILILLVILCFIIPPVSVAVVDGISTRFWIDLIFFILGWGVGGYFFRNGLAYLCTLVAIIYALLIVLGAI